MFRNLRLRLFYKLMFPISERMRRLRMADLSRFLGALGSGSLRILDIGGQWHIWQHIDRPLDITLLNLPGIMEPVGASHHHFTTIEGDGCNVHQFADREFDVVFSNSVIEHVGDDSHQEAFAREIRRLGRSYWVQTPCKIFPIEAHCGMPFWWYYPERVRQALMARWERRLPEWTAMVRGTRVLSAKRLTQLFPEGKISTETLLGIPKSHLVSWIG